DHDDGDLHVRRPHRSDQFHAVRPGHRIVDHHRIETLIGQYQGGFAGVAGHFYVKASPGQSCREELADTGRIVDDENPRIVFGAPGTLTGHHPEETGVDDDENLTT